MSLPVHAIADRKLTDVARQFFRISKSKALANGELHLVALAAGGEAHHYQVGHAQRNTVNAAIRRSISAIIFLYSTPPMPP